MSPGFEGSTGGTTYVYRLAETLAQQVPVHVLAFHGEESSRVQGVTFKRVREPVTLKGARHLTWKRTMSKLLSLVQEDSLLITCSATNAALSRTQGRKIRTVALVQSYEDFGLRAPRASLSERVLGLRKLAATGQLLRRGVSSADVVLANSDYMRAQVLRSFGSSLNVSVLHPPLDLDVRLLDSKRSVHKTTRAVGFYNRQGKNLEFVLRLAETLFDFSFFVFGHPIPSATGLPPNCSYCGWQSDRYAMYATARTWLVPSKWQEPFGMVATEALSQGCRVAVANVGGLPEAVGPHGKVFDGYDINEWAAWIREIQRTSVKEGHDEASDLKAHLAKFSLPAFRKAAMCATQQLMDH